MPSKLTTADFIERARVVHGDKYDYSLVDYKSAHGKVRIICPVHGEFQQQAASHTNGSGCRACSGHLPITTESFIQRAKAIYGDKYDYSEVDYKNNKTKVLVICPEHGRFKIIPKEHLLNKTGCSVCSGKKPITTREFIRRATERHGSAYDYSHSDVKGVDNRVANRYFKIGIRTGIDRLCHQDGSCLVAR